ncbi:MAG: oligosaccharide flippase family protein [Candidatus Micrarchaeia archaeon]
MKEEESIVKGSLYLSIAKFLSNLMLAFSIIIVARVIGASNYGYFVVAISLVGLLNSFGGFGIGPYLSAHIPRLKKEKKLKVISTTFYLNAIISSFLTVFAFLFLPNFSNTPLLVSIASLSILLNLIFAYFVNLFISLRRAGFSSLATIFQSFSQAFSSIILSFLNFGMYAPLIGLEIGYAIGIIVSLFFLKKLKIKIEPILEKKEIKKLFSFSSFLIISSIFSFFSARFAIVYLSKFVESSTIGNIGIVQNFIVVSDIIVGSIASVAMPIFATQEENRKRRVFGISLKYTFLLILFPIIILFLFPNFVINILFGKNYGEAIPYLKLYSIYLLFSFPWYLFSSLILAERRIKLYTFISVFGSVALLLLVPFESIFKAIGYFFALIISSFITNLLTFFLLRSKIGLRKKELFEILTASFIFFIFSYSISYFVKRLLEFFVAFFFLFFVYVFVLRLLIKKKEIEIIKISIKNSRLRVLSPFLENVWNFLGF